MLIAEDPAVNFKDFLDFSEDRDFKPIQNDKRWNASVTKIFENAKKHFIRGEKTGLKIKNRERIHAAAAFALINQPDSAFRQLNLIAESKDLLLVEMNDILRYTYFRTLYKNDLWPQFVKKLQENFAIITSSSLTKNASRIERLNAAVAWMRASQPDSAFCQLNIFADSRDLSFDDVQKFITNTRQLASDRRWKQLTQRMFVLLHERYIPLNTFSKGKGKRILIDEGHNNLHTISGTYATLSGVLDNVGFKIQGHNGKFDEATLKNVDVLIISNPLADVMDSIAKKANTDKQPTRWSDAASKSAYTSEEATAIEHWVQNGGSLLLILDHAPNPIAGSLIAEKLGVEIRNVSTYDRISRDPTFDTTVATTILFTRNKGIGEKHPVLNKVDSVVTVTGSSLVGPPNSEVLLYLSSTATDQDWLRETRQYRIRSAAGRSQAVAFPHGKGRVVVLGEAAMISADVISRPNRGNWQLTLNILKWLLHES